MRTSQPFLNTSASFGNTSVVQRFSAWVQSVTERRRTGGRHNSQQPKREQLQAAQNEPLVLSQTVHIHYGLMHFFSAHKMLFCSFQGQMGFTVQMTHSHMFMWQNCHARSQWRQCGGLVSCPRTHERAEWDRNLQSDHRCPQMVVRKSSWLFHSMILHLLVGFEMSPCCPATTSISAEFLTDSQDTPRSTVSRDIVAQIPDSHNLPASDEKTKTKRHHLPKQTNTDGCQPFFGK